MSAGEHKTSRRKLRATGDESYDVVNSGAEDWISDDTRTIEEALVLPDDEVCACLHETGSRQTRLYERCLRCGAFMEADYLRAELDRAREAAQTARDLLDLAVCDDAYIGEAQAVLSAALPSGRQHSREGDGA